MALAHPNQMIPFSTATTTAKDRPIMDWLPLARMATIIAITAINRLPASRVPTPNSSRRGNQPSPRSQDPSMSKTQAAAFPTSTTTMATLTTSEAPAAAPRTHRTLRSRRRPEAAKASELSCRMR